jgi:hypothetical protein
MAKFFMSKFVALASSACGKVSSFRPKTQAAVIGFPIVIRHSDFVIFPRARASPPPGASLSGAADPVEKSGESERNPGDT